jgi:hypothetical protein
LTESLGLQDIGPADKAEYTDFEEIYYCRSSVKFEDEISF